MSSCSVKGWLCLQAAGDFVQIDSTARPYAACQALQLSTRPFLVQPIVDAHQWSSKEHIKLTTINTCTAAPMTVLAHSVLSPTKRARLYPLLSYDDSNIAKIRDAASSPEINAPSTFAPAHQSPAHTNGSDRSPTGSIIPKLAIPTVSSGSE